MRIIDDRNLQESEAFRLLFLLEEFVVSSGEKTMLNEYVVSIPGLTIAKAAGQNTRIIRVATLSSLIGVTEPTDTDEIMEIKKCLLYAQWQGPDADAEASLINLFVVRGTYAGDTSSTQEEAEAALNAVMTGKFDAVKVAAKPVRYFSFIGGPSVFGKAEFSVDLTDLAKRIRKERTLMQHQGLTPPVYTVVAVAWGDAGNALSLAGGALFTLEYVNQQAPNRNRNIVPI